MREVIQTIMRNRIESERQKYQHKHSKSKRKSKAKSTKKKTKLPKKVVVAVFAILLLITITSFAAVHMADQSATALSVKPTPTSSSITIVQDFRNTGSYALGMSGAYVMNTSGIFPKPDSEVGNCFTTPTTALDYNLTDAEFVLNAANGAPSNGQVEALIFSATVNPLTSACTPNVSTGLIAMSLNTIPISSSTTGNLTFQFTVLPIFITLHPGTVYALSLRLTGCTVCNSSNFWRVATDGNPVSGGVLTFRVGGTNNAGFAPLTSISPSGMSFYYLYGDIVGSYGTFPAGGNGGGGSRPFEV